MDKGILLLALNKRNYGIMAKLMAASIKMYSPNVPICIVHDERAKIKGLERFADELKPIKKEHYILNDEFNPGYAKLCMNKYSPFDKTVYLDVDGICINPVKGLFDICSQHSFATQVIKYGDNQWCTAEVLQNKFNFTETPPHVSTVFMYFDKEDTILDIARESYVNHPLTGGEIGMMWGNHKQPRQPDEIYVSAACAINRIDPKVSLDPVFLSEEKNVPSLREIKKTHAFIGLGGMDTSEKVKSNITKQIKKVCAKMEIPGFKGADELWENKFVIKENLDQ